MPPQARRARLGTRDPDGGRVPFRRSGLVWDPPTAGTPEGMRARQVLCSAGAASVLAAACTVGSGSSESEPPNDDRPTAAEQSPDEPSSPDADDESPSQSGTSAPTVPTTGESFFPEHRLVGFSGGRSPGFGRLEASDLDAAAAELDELIPAYEAGGHQVIPVYELITVVAHREPTSSGLYRTVEPDDVIQQYLDAAREHGAILLLNVQPGRSEFLDEVRGLERWLREPDVGLALDPEWAVEDDEVPGEVYGSTTGAELDSVAAYVSDLVAEHELPEKVIVCHQLHPSIVQGEEDLRAHPGVALVQSVDGIGAREDKEKTWRRIGPGEPDHIEAGFKLFFDGDTQHGPLMTPEQVLALEPTPRYVLYE